MGDKSSRDRSVFSVEPPHEVDEQTLERIDEEKEREAAPLSENLERARREHESARAAAEEMRRQYAAKGRPLLAPLFTRREIIRMKRIAKEICSVEALHHIHQYELEIMSRELSALGRMIRRKAREEVDAWLEFYRRLAHLNDEESNRNGIGFLIRDEGGGGVYMCLAHFDPKYQDVLESPRIFDPQEFAEMRAYVEKKVNEYLESFWSETEKALTYARATIEITETLRWLHPQGAAITASFRGKDLERRKRLVIELRLEPEHRSRVEALLGVG
jgi:hypothetical protein